MKNLSKISLITLVILGICTSTALAVTGTINAKKGLTFREKASKDGNPITVIPNETQVEVLEKDGEWYKVIYNSQTGYVSEKYIKVTEEVSVAPQEGNEKSTQEQVANPTVTGTLKVYNLPLITSTVVNTIEPNAEIVVLKEITNWAYVSSGDIIGWVRSYGLNGGVTSNEEAPVENNETEITEPQPTQSEQEETTPVANTQPTEAEEPEKPTPTPTPTPKYQPSNTKQNEKSTDLTKGVVEVGAANVRKEASSKSEIVTTLTKGTDFTITAETEEWYKITYTGSDDTVYEGYVYKELVTAN